jgi:hypothetical protein
MGARVAPEEQCFVVRARGCRYELHHQEERDEWAVEDSFDGGALCARPDLEIRLVESEMVRMAQRRILACENCHAMEAQLPLIRLLADVQGTALWCNSYRQR